MQIRDSTKAEKEAFTTVRLAEWAGYRGCVVTRDGGHWYRRSTGWTCRAYADGPVMFAIPIELFWGPGSIM